MRKAAFLMILVLQIIVNQSFSQERRIIAQVIDKETGSPVSNVNVIIQGVNRETFSNFHGFFEIVISDPTTEKVLVASHIGYKTMFITIPEENNFRFHMEKDYVVLKTLDLLDNQLTSIDLVVSEEDNHASDFGLNLSEVDAAYPGGMGNFYNYVTDMLRWNVKKVLEDEVHIVFTINKYGLPQDLMISNAEAISSTTLMYLFENMSRWQPALQNGTEVPQHFILPVVNSPDKPPTDITHAAFFHHIVSNIQYPYKARVERIQGLVYAVFEVEDKRVKHVEIIRDYRGVFAAAVTDVLFSVPADLLAEISANSNSSKFLLPIAFGLDRKYRHKHELPETEAHVLMNIDVVIIGPGKYLPQPDLHRSSYQAGAYNEFGIPLFSSLGIFNSLETALHSTYPVQKLDLTNQGLEEIPSSLFSMLRLDFLSLESNRISTIPDNISRLKRLKEVYLYQNQIESLPEGTSKLRNLRTLGLSSNHFKVFPLPITQLSRLETLDLSDNQIETLPPEIGQMKNLTFLFLGRNKIQYIPDEIFTLKKLRVIDLRENPIDDFELDRIWEAMPNTIIYK